MRINYLAQPLKSLRGVYRYIQIFGPKGIFFALFCFISTKQSLVKAAPRWSRAPIYLRLNSSDIAVFRQVFLDREYSIVLDSGLQPNTIVDGGANIGLTSIFLSDSLPDARILAIEPESGNFDLLCINTQGRGNIIPVRGALWHTDAKLKLVSESSESWAFQVCESSDGDASIPARRISTLMNEFGFQRLSLLKLDIEGAELEVLSDWVDWRDQVDAVVLELHERLRPGCLHAFKSISSVYSSIFEHGELTLAIKDRAGSGKTS